MIPKLSLALALIFGSVVGTRSLLADALAAPTVLVVSSPNSSVIARIEPGLPEAVGTKLPKSAVCRLFSYDAVSHHYAPLRMLQLINPVMPSVVIVPDDGSYVLTFDNYFDNDNAVVLYNQSGAIARRWELKELFAEDVINRMQRFATIIQWHDSISIVRKDQSKVLILTVTGSGQPNEPHNPNLILDTRTATIQNYKNE